MIGFVDENPSTLYALVSLEALIIYMIFRRVWEQRKEMFHGAIEPEARGIPTCDTSARAEEP